MKTVIQRVSESEVFIDKKTSGKISKGILILLCVERGDKESDADYIAGKILNLRIFDDSQSKMNLSALEEQAELLVISQFTLSADCKKGRRPSFDSSAEPKEAEKLYKYFINKLRDSSLRVESGIFGAMMDIHLINDGPVTFIINSK